MAETILETRGLSKSFGALRANDSIDLTVRRGEIHAVIGPNGAGKSTLIDLIAGKTKPDAGTVHLNGTDVSTQGVAARAAAGLARTFQISALAMEDTVLSNALLGAIGPASAMRNMWRTATKDTVLVDRAMSALTRVGIADLHATRCADLSHGQRRELEVAVALTLSPRIFVMDEPMAGLGTEGTAKMTRLLDDLRTEAPILLVEHDMDAVFALADRITVLVYGRVIASGSVAEIRNDAEVRAAYLGDDV